MNDTYYNRRRTSPLYMRVYFYFRRNHAVLLLLHILYKKREFVNEYTCRCTIIGLKPKYSNFLGCDSNEFIRPNQWTVFFLLEFVPT